MLSKSKQPLILACPITVGGGVVCWTENFWLLRSLYNQCDRANSVPKCDFQVRSRWLLPSAIVPSFFRCDRGDSSEMRSRWLFPNAIVLVTSVNAIALTLLQVRSRWLIPNAIVPSFFRCDRADSSEVRSRRLPKMQLR